MRGAHCKKHCANRLDQHIRRRVCSKHVAVGSFFNNALWRPATVFKVAHVPPTIPLATAHGAQRSFEVSSLESVAAVASDCQSVWVVRPTMLFGNYMFDVKRHQRSGRLRHPTVFAGVAGAAPNEPTDAMLHVIGRVWTGTVWPWIE